MPFHLTHTRQDIDTEKNKIINPNLLRGRFLRAPGRDADERRSVERSLRSDVGNALQQRRSAVEFTLFIDDFVGLMSGNRDSGESATRQP